MSKLLFVPVMLSIVFTLTANTKDEDKSQSISNHLAVLRSLSTLGSLS